MQNLVYHGKKSRKLFTRVLRKAKSSYVVPKGLSFTPDPSRVFANFRLAVDVVIRGSFTGVVVGFVGIVVDGSDVVDIVEDVVEIFEDFGAKI